MRIEINKRDNSAATQTFLGYVIDRTVSDGSVNDIGFFILRGHGHREIRELMTFNFFVGGATVAYVIGWLVLFIKHCTSVRYFPKNPFRYKFLNELLSRFYKI